MSANTVSMAFCLIPLISLKRGVLFFIPMENDDCREMVFKLTDISAGLRLDVAISNLMPDQSRSFLGKLIRSGAILLDGKKVKPNRKVVGAEEVVVTLPEPEILEATPKNIPLDVLFEDSDLIVVNKAAGMPSHPSPGHPDDTLVNALLWHCTDLSSINGTLRPGIVHRLDMDTSGVMVAAKNDRTHRMLQEQFAERNVKKQYLAICHGSPSLDVFDCDGRIGRHPVRRKEMTVMRKAEEGREAFTAFEVQHRLDVAKGGRNGFNVPVFMVLAKPRTGRTHQIRVHLAKSGFPVLADRFYGKESEIPALKLNRHALHAWKLEISHPGTGTRMVFEAPLAADLQWAWDQLKNKFSA